VDIFPLLWLCKDEMKFRVFKLKNAFPMQGDAVFPATFAEGGATRQLTDVNAECRSSAVSVNKEARNNRQISGDVAFHKSNPSSVPRGIVDSYSTLPWATWGR